MAPQPHADMTSGSEIHATAPHHLDSPGSVVRLTLEGARAAPSEVPAPLPPAWLSSPAFCVWTATSEIRLAAKPNVSVLVFFPCPFHPPLSSKGIPWMRNALVCFYSMIWFSGQAPCNFLNHGPSSLLPSSFGGEPVLRPQH